VVTVEEVRRAGRALQALHELAGERGDDGRILRITLVGTAPTLVLRTVTVGAKVHSKPVVRTCWAVTRAMSPNNFGLRVAPRPTLCGTAPSRRCCCDRASHRCPRSSGCRRHRRWCRSRRHRTRPRVPAISSAARIRRCRGRNRRRSAPNPGDISHVRGSNAGDVALDHLAHFFFQRHLLEQRSNFSSSAASLANGHFGEGQISGWTAAGSSAFAAGAGAALLSAEQPSRSASDNRPGRRCAAGGARDARR